MNISSALGLLQGDKDWLKKLAIGVVLLVTGLGTILVFGWCVEIARRAGRGETPALPDWAPWGERLVMGLKFVAILLIWQLPVLAFTPVLLLGEVEALTDLWGEQWLGGVALGYVICGSAYALLMGLVAPPTLAVLAASGSLLQALNPVITIRQWAANPGGYLLAFGAGSLIILVAACVGLLACFVGIYPALVYGYAVYAQLCGQAHRPQTSPSTHSPD
jgi:hypothetical protein